MDFSPVVLQFLSLSLPPGVAYAVVAAFVWGTYIFALKRYFADYPGTVLTVVVNTTAILWYLPVTLTTPAAAAFDPGAVGLGDAGVVLLTVVTTAAAFLVFLAALDAGEVSYVAPINKVVPAFVLPIEVLLLHERLAPIQLVGVVVTTLAVYVANYRRGRLLEPVKKAVTARPAQLALFSAMCYAVSDVGKRLVLQEMGVPPSLWVPTLLAGVVAVLLPFVVRDWVPVREDLPKFVLAGAGVALGEHVTSLAFAAAPASIASPVINTQAVVAVLLGGLVLREEAFGVRLVAAALAVAGVGLIAL
ncbi:EamA family transporter [Halogeometricum limi]|uniref:EamA-like transporter family protein n=1 Tax=Halogeometricum limi TaxID=555875 RepID=A0A1I6H5R7_9EURY|nr:EamA family transporter [Halogeometricum limi]SFR49795.1 EamA-like transporter family protein [Halogeometricum limi]